MVVREVGCLDVLELLGFYGCVAFKALMVLTLGDPLGLSIPAV